MTPRRGSIFDEYRSMLKVAEVEELLDLVVYRPLAYGLVKLVQPTPVTPNQITFVSLLLGLASGVCYWQGTPVYLVYGAVLLFLTNVVDCADGMLARIRGSGSLTGYLFDGLVDYTTNAAVLIGMLHGLSVVSDRGTFVWLVGVPAGLSYAWWCAMVDRFRNEWMDKVHNRRRDPQLELSEMRGITAGFAPGTHKWDRTLIGVYGVYVRLWYSASARGIASPGGEISLDAWRRARRPIIRAAVALGPSMHLSLMMLAGVANRLDWYLWFSLVFGTGYGLAVLNWRTLVDRKLEQGVLKGARH